ncbi:MAG: cyclic nucleotide-binding domain-containing protein [Candidatus Poribacteria bacterium]|nr:cyclic nucleotide-binding domain-containing protein [Candidatus Poribacteria bacterium]
MTKRLQKFLNINPGEGIPVLILFAYFFFLVASVIAGKTARDTYFLTRFDKSYLPLMYVAVAAATGFSVAVYTRLSKRISLIPITAASGLFFAASLIPMQFHLEGWVIPFLYVWIDVVTTLMFPQFWILASTFFNSRQAKRLFVIIGSGSAIAGIVVGSGIQPFVRQFGSSNLLILTSVFILCCVLMAWLSKSHVLQSTTAGEPVESHSKKSRFWDGYLKKITLSIGVAAMATAIIDYQFKIISSNYFPSEADLAKFFGTFYAITNVIALVIQFFLTGRILTKFGVSAGLLILPVGLGMGAATLLFSPILMSILVAKSSDQVTKFSINDTSLQLLWVPITPQRKRAVKPIVDGTIKNGLQGLTGVAMFIFLKRFEIQYLSLIALGLITIWIINTFRLRKGYVSALMSAIEKRQLNFEELRLDVTDSNIISTIETALKSDEEAQQVFALELISNLSPDPWRKTLNHLFKHGSFLVRQKILAIAWESPEIISDMDLLSIIASEGPLANEAVVIAGRRRITEVIPTLTGYLNNPASGTVEIRAAVATAILLMNQGPLALAHDTLEAMLTSPDETSNTTALRTLVNAPLLLPVERLHDFLLSNSPQIRYAALEIAQERSSPYLMSAVAENLKHPQTATLARRILRKFPGDQTVRLLMNLCRHPDTEQPQMLEIIRTLKEYPIKRTMYHLVVLLNHENLPVRAEVADTLLEIARQEPLTTEVLDRIRKEIHRVAKSIYANYQFLDLLQPTTNELLLTDLLNYDIQKATAVLGKLSVVHVPETPIEQYIYYVQSGDKEKIANVLEILDNIIPNMKEREVIIPLIEPISVHERCLSGQQYFDDLPDNLDTVLLDLVQSPDEWRSAVALDYALRHERSDVLNRLDWDGVSALEANQDLISHYLLQNGKALNDLPQFPVARFQNDGEAMSMFSTLEKTIRLKGMDLFKDIPAEEVFYVAQVTEEIRLPADTTFIQEGEVGDAVYIIVTGEILIHRDGKELNKLKKGDAVGEIALLDQGPRSASCTTVDETILLKINQDDFYDVMASRVEFMKGVLKALSGKVRRLTELYIQDS